ncbi:MAG: hypothetical protein QW735_00870 [archaeon]
MKGYIGPLGDDIPGIISIVLAFSIFFAGFSIAMTTLNEKTVVIQKFKGTMEIAKAINSKTVLPENLEDLRKDAQRIATTRALQFNLSYKDTRSQMVCGEKAFYLTYFVARYNQGQTEIVPDILTICVW